MKQGQLDYLLSRGYTVNLLREEGVFGVKEGDSFHGKVLKDASGTIAWPVFSMSGIPVGVQTRELEEKKYRFYQLPNTEHLPLMFGTPADFRLMWESGKMILTEGAFDRAAVKRALPDYPVFARMSKGAPNQLRSLIRRYVRHLWTVFDNDDPGNEAAETTEKKLKDLIEVTQLKTPYKDPSIMVEKRGLAALKACLDPQIRMTDFT